MTTFKCKTCGSHWSEGPTRDHVEDQDCRHCAASDQDNLRARVAELEDAIRKAIAMPHGHSETRVLVDALEKK